jgi:hypothetical protein
MPIRIIAIELTIAAIIFNAAIQHKESYPNFSPPK